MKLLGRIGCNWIRHTLTFGHVATERPRARLCKTCHQTDKYVFARTHSFPPTAHERFCAICLFGEGKQL